MYEFKLQIGCLLIVLYVMLAYVKETLDRKINCNKIFDCLLALSPWAIIFDGATAWTVNHQDIVPAWLNLLLHGLFFISMDMVIILTFLYMLYQTIGLRNRKLLVLFLTPGLLSIVGVLVFMNRLYYIEGKTTYYSMGTSVIICYASLVIHFIMISVLLTVKHHTLEKRKLFSIMTLMLICMGTLFIQVIMPESLVSSLLPTFVIIGIYMTFENPSFHRLQKYNAEMVTGFANLVENRDNSTGGHIRRTKVYVEIILKAIRKKPKYRAILTKDYIENVKNAAPMHDIGKIATPDYILQKPGKLTDEEYAIMKKHSEIGGEIIQETFAKLEEPEYEQIAYEVARYHHEKWNGKGYPDGLKGTEIPLHARIMAVADVFDALSAKRCYRDAMPIEKCFQIIREGSGTDFDPELVEIFLDAREEILRYYEAEKE